jgi:hypothetical protein
MQINPIHNISAERAIDLLGNGLPLVDSYVEGEIKIIGDNNWNKELTIENCVIEYFEGSDSQFKKPIRFINTHFKDCRFIFSYFLQGLAFENCVFDKYLDFQAGGHNQAGYPVLIKNNTFFDFVNFFDCWYNGEIVIRDNKFLKGTNIESQKQYISFDIVPQIFNNTGQTNIEAETV